MSKNMKCKCGKECEVGERTTEVICSDCTEKNHQLWLEKQIKEQEEFHSQEDKEVENEMKGGNDNNMTDENINVPLSMCKKFLSQNGMRVTPEATKKFEEMLRIWSAEVSTKATQKVTDNKRKTIDVQDLEE